MDIRKDRPYTIRLTEDEALVLSDWLDRVMHRKDFSQLVDDRAVWAPLYAISGALETTLPHIFASNYGELLDASRGRLLEKLGESGEENG